MNNYKEKFFDFCIKYGADLRTGAQILSQGITEDTHDIYCFDFGRVYEIPISNVLRIKNYSLDSFSVVFMFDVGVNTGYRAEAHQVFAVTPKNHITWYRVIREQPARNLAGRSVLDVIVVDALGVTDPAMINTEFSMIATELYGFGGHDFPDGNWSWHGDQIIAYGSRVLSLEKMS